MTKGTVLETDIRSEHSERPLSAHPVDLLRLKRTSAFGLRIQRNKCQFWGRKEDT